MHSTFDAIFGSVCIGSVLIGVGFGVFRLLWLVVVGPPKPKPKLQVADEPDDECDHCDYPLLDDQLVCPECGNPTRAVRRIKLRLLAEALPSTPMAERKPDLGERQIVVHMSDDGAVVRAIKMHLQVRGMIVRHVLPQRSGGVYKKLGSHKILVFENDEQYAREIITALLAELEKGPGDDLASPVESAERGNCENLTTIPNKTPDPMTGAGNKLTE